jgi:hypothetical protein
LRPYRQVPWHEYTDPLDGVEENLAYNAFLVGESLLGRRVADVLAAVRDLRKAHSRARIVLCGRRDSALVACLAGAIEPQIDAVAAEEMWASFLPLFEPQGKPINAASILPQLLRDFGDVEEILRTIAPRPIFLAAAKGATRGVSGIVRSMAKPFAEDPGRLVEWLRAL